MVTKMCKKDDKMGRCYFEYFCIHVGKGKPFSAKKIDQSYIWRQIHLNVCKMCRKYDKINFYP